MKISNTRTVLFFTAVSAIAVMSGGHGLLYARSNNNVEAEQMAKISPLAGEVISPGFAGDFLASYHAQSQYDWKNAHEFLERVLLQDPENPELLRRAMILAMGSGDLDAAAQRAEQLKKILPDSSSNALGLMILAVHDISENDLASALKHIDEMTAGDMTDFIRPILRSWILSGQGQFEIKDFNPTTVHLYHAGLMAIINDKMSAAREYADKIAKTEGLSSMEIERAADLYAAIGDRNTALDLYKKLVEERTNEGLEDKITAVSTEGSDLSQILRPLMVKTTQQGVSLAMFDMANILYNDQTDSSSKLFAHMALALDPDLIDARLLLADSLARNGRLQEAIGYFKDIPETHSAYIPAQRYAADLLAEAGDIEQAKAILAQLFTKYNDVESLIRIGDMYRAEENYKDAVVWYNKAATQVGSKIPEDYWHLLYARGMAYERQGDWSNAERDLKAALTYRPDHPYLLNYLGYGWADQGLNLSEALKMIERAVSLRPSDGYITDSLGWVHYMMGNYKESIPYLERAVALLPYDSVINDHLGDAYWQVGRRMEARFQWERSFNYAEDNELKQVIERKLKDGLPMTTPTRAAHKDEN
ncbi:MAG: tetratricopeptide repeat protein [Micavibrio sp.]